MLEFYTLRKALFSTLALTISILQITNATAADTLILDNSQPGTSFKGTWKVSGGVNPYGSNSLYAGENGASYTFDANLATPGEYQVFAWWTEWSNAGTSKFVVDFDAPTPPGSPRSLLSGVFEGIDFGQGQWRWEGAWTTNPSNHVYFDSKVGQSRDFQFARSPAVLTGMRVTAGTSGVLTLSDDAGQILMRSLAADTLVLIETGWTEAANTVTVSYSAGWELAVDDITYAEPADESNRRTSVPIDITHSGGTSTVTVNQRQNGGQWNQLGATWNFDTTASIAIRSLGNGTTSADAIKLEYVGNNTASPVFPVDLRGNTPEQASITINTNKPAGATSGIITLATYDADFPDEGELVINGNTPVTLFGTSGVSGNDQNSANISFSTPASYWRNGDNTLLFRHTSTQGYVIDAVAVSFEAAANTNTPPTINGSPATAVTVGNNYEFQPNASDADGDPLTFSITNRPSWASFDSSTGRLSGTPGTAGTFNNIRISVSDGPSTVELLSFSITVDDAAPQTGSVFPVDLRGNPPEQASVTLNTNKPAGATSGVITLTTYDADFRDEGELVINGNTPVALFGTSGVSANDQNSADISFSTPASYWRNGDNTLLFRHTRTQGYIIDAATVSFEAAANTNTPPTINGSPAAGVTVGNNYVFQPSASDADDDPLTFSITNRPSWASFDSSTGRLSGTPGTAGTFNNIRISVSDGPSTVELPSFSISVDDAAPQTGSEFPVDLRGSTPEEASITLNTTKPAGASNGVITLTTYDADFSNEGELIINGNPPVQLFGSAGVSGNDQNSADISLSTPASYWRNGDNTLLFRHTSTQGYIIDAATVSFDDAAPQTGTGSVSLTWTPPVARADGSALAMSEIDGYTVRYGESAGDYPNSQNVNGGSSTSTTIANLPVGTTFYMVVTTRDSDGRESVPSSMVTKLVK